MIKRIAGIARGLLSDPAVCVAVGSMLLLRGIVAMQEQAKTVVEQTQQAYAALAQVSAVQAEANGFRPQPAPDVAGRDVAGEHEDVHP